MHGILKIASKDAVPKSYTGYKRKVRDELPSDCVLKVPVGPDETGKMVHIAVTHLPKYFQYMAVRSVPFARRLLSVVDRSMGSLLQPLLYWDEVVSGNPLAPHSAKKVAIGYVTLSELQQRQKEEVWFPLFIAQHTSLESVAGGFSKMMREVVLLLQSFHMEHGIALELDGYHRLLRVNLMQGYFIADFDEEVPRSKRALLAKMCAKRAPTYVTRKGISQKSQRPNGLSLIFGRTKKFLIFGT